MQLDFDPGVVSFEELLDKFWEWHRPYYPSGSQYKSAVYYHNEEQEAAARESMALQAKRVGKEIFTDVEPLGPWYLAEKYHQK